MNTAAQIIKLMERYIIGKVLSLGKILAEIIFVRLANAGHLSILRKLVNA